MPLVSENKVGHEHLELRSVCQSETDLSFRNVEIVNAMLKMLIHSAILKLKTAFRHDQRGEHEARPVGINVLRFVYRYRR